MANRQIIWLCKYCTKKHMRRAGESITVTCPNCDKEHGLYPLHDANIGSSKMSNGGRLEVKEKKHEPSGVRKPNRYYKDVPYSEL